MADIFDYIKELVKIEIEFEDEEGIPHTLKSYIKGVDEGRILIHPPGIKNKTFDLPDGQPISIIISTKEGQFAGGSKVIGKELATISGLWVDYPYNSQHIQRREYLRIPIKLNVDIIISEDANYKTKNELKVISRDLSGKGFSFITDAPLPQYYDIECAIHIDDEIRESILSRCEHIYSKPVKVNDDIKYIHALAFIDISERDSERIIKRGFKYQLELRRKGLV